MSSTVKDVTKVLFSYKTLTHAIAGSTGSVVAMSVFFPLDTVRSRMQLEDKIDGSTLKVIKDLIMKEGPYTLYRGMVPVLQSLCASNFVYFYTFHGLKLYQGRDAVHTAGKDLLLASIAGIVNVLTTTPLWVVNTKMKMQGINRDNIRYRTILEGLNKVAKESGPLSLWAGTAPSLLLVCNPAIQLMVYEGLKRQLAALFPDKKFGSLAYFLIGALSKTVATVLTYPLQILQAKQRHGHSYKDLQPRANMFQLCEYILRNFGVAGLYKGIEAKLLQTVLTSALMFATYEKIAAFVFALLRAPK